MSSSATADLRLWDFEIYKYFAIVMSSLRDFVRVNHYKISPQAAGNSNYVIKTSLHYKIFFYKTYLSFLFLPSDSFSISFLNFITLFKTFLSEVPIISTASNAAFFALLIATVATGTPYGI